MKTYRAITPGRRQMSLVSFKGLLTASRPQKFLTRGFQRKVGRGAGGRITVRHKGGGHKRRFRLVDFSLKKFNIPFRVQTVEYDPNRSGFIGLAVWRDGGRGYVLLPQTTDLSGEFLISETAPVKIGNRLPLSRLEVGSLVYNIELKPGAGAKLVRSAGNFAELAAKAQGYADLKLPSGEIRRVSEKCWASIGQVSNPENRLTVSGKAGRGRWLGIRPTVRGSAMNPVDHPYGGGEGRSGRGLRRAKTKWGRPAGKGQKTRRAKKYSNRFILKRRGRSPLNA